MKVTRSTAKAELLPFSLCNCKAHEAGPSLSCCVVHIFRVRGSARGFGKGGRVESPNKTFKCNSFDGAAVRGQLSEAV